MTNIKFYYNANKIIGFECDGHSGYAESGSDIVCASISALTGACHLGLTEVLGLNVDFKRNLKKGYFSLILNKTEDIEKAQVLFKTLMLSITEIEKEYSEFVKIENRREK